MTDTRALDAVDDPAAIEQDIRRTQDDMSRTVDKLGDQLTMKNLFNAILEKADDNGVDAEYLLDGARRNPIALGLIAAGAIWLVSDKDSKFPALSSSGKARHGRSDELDIDGRDIHHRDYVAHMSAIDMRDGEDQAAYQRRRDVHRANFLMCERKPDEDDHSFSQRLDDLTDKFREKRRAWSDTAAQAGSATAESAQQAVATARATTLQAANRARDVYDRNPLVGGILAAAVGAALGSTVPISRKEQETFGEMGADAREMIAERKDELTDQLREKKDELVEKADATIQSSAGSQQSEQGQRSENDRGSQGEDQSQGSERPFIISEPAR